VKKERIDILLVERGIVESRTRAQQLVMAGQVRVDGQVALKPSSLYQNDVAIEVLETPRFVSRGGEKLQAALDVFHIQVEGKICADVGASTGGFTDCLLQNGARRVYAIDVGKGILHWKLRQDPRVIPLEGVNARYLESLPEPPGLVTIDASFISSKLLLIASKLWLAGGGGELIVLIKPQFEAGKTEADRGEGVITDPEVHRGVLANVLNHAQSEGFEISGLMRSPLLGQKGNVEFLAYLVVPGGRKVDLYPLIDQVLTA
jgi:23S rRNA (cytidine1920-2'-O)/16S rRNA (cytidine1409-2'-O)-methyltransferase